MSALRILPSTPSIQQADPSLFLSSSLVTMNLLLRCLTLLLLSASAPAAVAATKSIDELRQSSDWVTLQDGIEFQSADSSVADDPRMQAATEQAKARMLNAGDTQEGYQMLFGADGLNTKYNILSTAWRYLGFYIDCSVTGNGDDKHRDLGGGGNNNNKNSGCMRYLMWAVVRCRGWSARHACVRFILSGSNLALLLSFLAVRRFGLSRRRHW
jgi:opacity protein-like surface antigen